MMLFIHEYRKAKIEYKDELFRLFLQRDHEREQRGKDVNVQDIQIATRSSRSQYQYTLQGSDLGVLFSSAPKMVEKMRALPQLRDVSSDLQIANPQLVVELDRVVPTLLFKIQIGQPHRSDRRALRRLFKTLAGQFGLIADQAGRADAREDASSLRVEPFRLKAWEEIGDVGHGVACAAGFSDDVALAGVLGAVSAQSGRSGGAGHRGPGRRRARRQRVGRRTARRRRGLHAQAQAGLTAAAGLAKRNGRHDPENRTIRREWRKARGGYDTGRIRP